MRGPVSPASPGRGHPLSWQFYRSTYLYPKYLITSSILTTTMIFDPAPIDLPSSYEKVPTTGQVVVSHHPPGTPSVTPVIIVTLNRPEKSNAFTSKMVEDFEKLFPMFDVDERVKVVVLTGAGKIFCAGADLEIGFRSNPERPKEHRDGYEVLLSFSQIETHANKLET